MAHSSNILTNIFSFSCNIMLFRPLLTGWFLSPPIQDFLISYTSRLILSSTPYGNNDGPFKNYNLKKPAQMTWWDQVNSYTKSSTQSYRPVYKQMMSFVVLLFLQKENPLYDQIEPHYYQWQMDPTWYHNIEKGLIVECKLIMRWGAQRMEVHIVLLSWEWVFLLSFPGYIHGDISIWRKDKTRSQGELSIVFEPFWWGSD